MNLHSVKLNLPYYHLIFIFIFLSNLGCKKEEVIEGNEDELIEETSSLDTDDTAISLEGDLQISDFIWEGLNTYYYWQEEVEALADSKLEDEKAYAEFISQNADPELFFDSLLHPEDRFSWIEEDYVELENSLQGIYASNGVEFGLAYACQDCNEIVGYVKYILEDSDASNKNIKRGDYFTGVNGITLTVGNYRNLLFGDELSYTLNMADSIDGNLVLNGINVELTKEENFETNPIQISKTIDTNAGKIGYLMYNQFVADKSPQLNEVFGNFKSEGIIDLVVDLRYNGGGSVANCIELASMITGQFNGEIFAKEKWNSKLTTYFEERYGAERLIERFVDVLSDGESINSLSLNRVFILTTSSSASASELLINSLSAYIDVVHIGEKTVGKNVGSITVYDYIDNDGNKNPDHTYAMQPIVLKIANKDDFAEYTDGLEPNTAIDEEIKNLGILGDPSEPLLATAISILSGTGKVTPYRSSSKNLRIGNPIVLKRQGMHLDKTIHSFQGKR
ncbi:S41 family peptidase [Flavobacteriaceae bacterium]|jgi:carboxyl-terminal processing protease|nr:S41 family peptidase [Flavobacteriaceae bacterium]